LNRIKLLEKQISELIAAGEVVERPASAAKELLENAIDAGATAITLEIKNGGISFLRITDNGLGIVREDVPTAFLRHATSKISTADDLDAISTLGFRGEALASIAAVSRLEMFTRTKDELAGTLIQLEGGKITHQGDAGSPEGTTIIVRDLFFNTPARMKFLKKDISEANAVSAVVERLALSHPEISFRYIKDGREGGSSREELHTPGDNKLISVIHSVLGKEFASTLLPLDYEYQGVLIDGYITKPTAARPNRNMQFFYLNGRLVKSRTIMAALEEANKNSVMTGKYPGCVMNITMNTSLVDVNVHPAKIEVRFANEKQLFDAVYYAVKTTLSTLDVRPELALSNTDKNLINSNIPQQGEQQLNFDLTGRLPKKEENITYVSMLSPTNTSYEPIQNEKNENFNINNLYFPLTETKDSTELSLNNTFSEQHTTKMQIPTQEQPQKALNMPIFIAFRIIGECFNTYILVEKDNELWLIDKHAAHERIIYNELKAKGQTSAQILLTPVSCTLSREEYDAVMCNTELLQSAGFEVEDFGSLTVLIREAPMMVRSQDIMGAVQELAGYLIMNKKGTMTERIDFLYNSVACRAAIKAGDKTSMMELENLAKNIMQSDEIHYCPHGRPVAIRLSKKDIEKQFGR
jgi:DNA mismatch repair protein MutL